MSTDRLTEALLSSLTSPNVSDSNGEAANLVDTVDELGRALWGGLLPKDGSGERRCAIEEHGNAVERGLLALAEAVRQLASAVAER